MCLHVLPPFKTVTVAVSGTAVRVVLRAEMRREGGAALQDKERETNIRKKFKRRSGRGTSCNLCSQFTFHCPSIVSALSAHYLLYFSCPVSSLVSLNFPQVSFLTLIIKHCPICVFRPVQLKINCFPQQVERCIIVVTSLLQTPGITLPQRTVTSKHTPVFTVSSLSPKSHAPYTACLTHDNRNASI